MGKGAGEGNERDFFLLCVFPSACPPSPPLRNTAANGACSEGKASAGLSTGRNGKGKHKQRLNRKRKEFSRKREKVNEIKEKGKERKAEKVAKHEMKRNASGRERKGSFG